MRLTFALAILIIAAFAGVLLFVGDVEAFYDFYGFSGPNLMQRPYVLLTSVFLHAGLEHLLSNLLVLIFFGLAAEKELGSWKMLAVFLAGAAAGDLLSLLVYPFDTVSVGASAGIFALIGVGMLVRPLDLSLYPLVVPVPLLFLGIAYALYNVYGFFFLAGDNISYAGHFGGLLVGLAVGFRIKGLRRSLRLLLLGAAALALIAIVVALVLLG